MVVDQSLRHFESRVRAGFAASWIASIMAAFVAGCVYTFFMEHGYALEYSKAIASGERSAWTVMLVVGGVAATFTAVISALVLAFIWWPLCRLLLRREVTSLVSYLSLGMLVSVALAVVMLVIQYFFQPLMSGDLFLGLVAILFSGLVASLTFWLVMRPDQKK